MSRYKDWPKNPRRGVQMAPEHERTIGVQRSIQHFQSAEWHSERSEFPCIGLWPNGLQVTIRHTFFDLYVKGYVRIHTLITRAYFLQSSDLYKQIEPHNLAPFLFYFLCSKRHTFLAPKLLIFYDPLSEYCCLNQGFQVSKRIEQISLNPKTSS